MELSTLPVRWMALLLFFATLIPVAIVAIAMAATMSAPFTISVEVKTQSNKDASQNVSISVNDRERNGLAVGVKADDKVTITFGDETSYDSNGFYAGNASAVTDESARLKEGYSYSFVVEGDATITLWVELKEYNVVYQDEEGNEIKTAKTLYHGDALETIDDQAFAGWVVKTAPEGYKITNNVFDTASFGISGDYVLKATDKLSMVVEYYAADADGTLITTQTIYQGQEVGLLPLDDEKVTSAIKPGYAAEKWLAEGEEVTSLTFNAGETVELVLDTSLLTYTTDVKFHKNSDDLAELTFDVEKGFAEYQTRQNYTLAGFEYDGEMYNYNVVSGVIDYVNDKDEKLSAVIAAAQGSDVETHAQLTAVWDADTAIFKGFENNFSFIFVPVANGNIDASVSVKLPGASDHTALTKKDEYGITFDRDEKYDLNQTLYSFFTGSDEAIVYLQNGESTDYSITYRIEQGGESISGTSKDATFAEFINKLVDYGGYEDKDPVYIYFNFI